jgi:TonB family protein
MKISEFTLLAAAGIGAALCAPGSAKAADEQGADNRFMRQDLIACLKPRWPGEAWKQHASGVTTVRIRIDVQGDVADVEVAESSGRADLDNAVLRDVRRCRFLALAAAGLTPTGWLRLQYVWTWKGQAIEAPHESTEPARGIEEVVAAAEGGNRVAQKR